MSARLCDDRPDPEAPALDLLVERVDLLTADPATPRIPAARVGIRHGRFALVEAAEGEPPRAHQVIMGRDLLAMPGLVNVHTHACLTMLRGVAEDLGFAPAYTRGVAQGYDLTPDEAVAFARLGALEALTFGSTLVNDTYDHADLTLPAMAETGLRVTACGRIRDVDFRGIMDGRWEHDPAIGRATLDDALALHARFDGREGGRLGVQLAAHAPDTCSAGLLREVRAAQEATGMRVTTHLAQSPTEVRRVQERDGMSPVELLDQVGLLGPELIAAHCIWMQPSDLARAGRARIHVAHVPKGNATGGTAAPIAELRAAGARVALATDNMHADMIEAMRWALNIGRVRTGAVEPEWQPADVFAMATRTGAAAMGLGAEIGEVSVGRKADLVLIDTRRPHWRPLLNPLGSLVHVGQGRDVRHVIIDGRVVLRDGEPTLVSSEEIMDGADRAARALWARVAT